MDTARRVIGLAAAVVAAVGYAGTAAAQEGEGEGRRRCCPEPPRCRPHGEERPDGCRERARDRLREMSPEERKEALERMRERRQGEPRCGDGEGGGQGRERFRRFLENHPDIRERLENMDPEQRRELLQKIRERLRGRRCGNGGEGEGCGEGRERFRRFLENHPEIRERLENMDPEQRREALQRIRQHLRERCGAGEGEGREGGCGERRCGEEGREARRRLRERRDGCRPRCGDGPRHERRDERREHDDNGVRDHGEGEGRDGHGQGNGRGHGPEEHGSGEAPEDI